MRIVVVTFLLVEWLSLFSDGLKYWSSLAPTTNWKWRRGWKIKRSTYKGEDSVLASPNPDGSTNKVNEILLSQGSYYLNSALSGTEFYAAPINRTDCLTLSYKVWFEDGFDFAYGGKLPGLYGGGINCTAGRDPGKDCFTARFIWRPGGVSGTNLFAPRSNQISAFCAKTDVECNQDWGHRIKLANMVFMPNRWYNIQETIRLNTPGRANGMLRVNLMQSGLLFRADNIIFRNSDSVKIDGILFSTFFGGNAPCSASPKDQSVYFRQFQLKDNYCP